VKGRLVAPIVAAEPASMAEWDAAFASAARASFFHGSVWSRVWEQYSGGRYRPAPLRVEFADGRSVIVARTLERTRYGVDRWHLSPAGTYGGWLAPEPLPEEHARALAQLLLGAASIVWFGATERPCEDAPSRLETTYVIDLASGPDAARARWHSDARRHVRRATRAGVSIREAEMFADWAAYYRSYLATRERWKSPSSSYEFSLFRLLHEARSPAVRLWLAEQGDAVVGGALAFAHDRSVVGWHSAQPERGSGVFRLLLWEIVQRLADEGFETLDLGPSGGHAGVIAFKESLGGRPVSFPVVTRTTPIERALLRVDRLDRRLREARQQGAVGAAAY
jgi:hypothetical protein